MTVKELIEKLSEFDEDSEVGFSYKFGDYWNTTVVATAAYVEEHQTRWSEYHKLNRLVHDEDDYYDDVENKTFVVIES